MTEAANMQVTGQQADRKRLIIDLAKCDQCPACELDCEWERGRPHGGLLQGNDGEGAPVGAGLAREGHRPHGGLLQGAMMGLREKATLMLICRRCEHASCVIACPFDAIERQEDGILKRHNLRCVSCKSCAHACPFGTIYPEMLTFYDMPYETFCASCLEHSDTEPACVASCSQGALEYRETDSAGEDVHILDDGLAARATRWVKQEMAQ